MGENEPIPINPAFTLPIPVPIEGGLEVISIPPLTGEQFIFFLNQLELFRPAIVKAGDRRKAAFNRSRGAEASDA